MDAFLNSLFLSGNWQLVLAGVVLLFLSQKAGGEKLNLSGFLRMVIDRIRGKTPEPKPTPMPDVPPVKPDAPDAPILPNNPILDEILRTIRDRLLNRLVSAQEESRRKEKEQIVSHLIPEVESLYKEVIPEQK